MHFSNISIIKYGLQPTHTLEPISNSSAHSPCWFIGRYRSLNTWLDETIVTLLATNTSPPISMHAPRDGYYQAILSYKNSWANFNYSTPLRNMTTAINKNILANNKEPKEDGSSKSCLKKTRSFNLLPHKIFPFTPWKLGTQENWGKPLYFIREI